MSSTAIDHPSAAPGGRGGADWISNLPSESELSVLVAMLGIDGSPRTQDVSQALPITLDETLWHLRSLALKELVAGIDPTESYPLRLWQLTDLGRAWARAWLKRWFA